MTDKEKGYLGEEAASEFLQRQGYEILERNYTIRGGEIDIIARSCDTLIFVEVKTRTDRTAVAAEAVDGRKISRMLKSAETYILEKSENCADMKIRFDCIEVYFTSQNCGGTEINHIQNIDVT